jgi:hypothetical protein
VLNKGNDILDQFGLKEGLLTDDSLEGLDTRSLLLLEHKLRQSSSLKILEVGGEDHPGRTD